MYLCLNLGHKYNKHIHPFEICFINLFLLTHFNIFKNIFLKTITCLTILHSAYEEQPELQLIKAEHLFLGKKIEYITFKRYFMKNIFALTLASTISLCALAAPTYKSLEVHAPKPGETQYKPAELTPDKIRALSLKSPEVRTEAERRAIDNIIRSKLSDPKISLLAMTNDLSTAARNYPGLAETILNRLAILAPKAQSTEKKGDDPNIKLAAEADIKLAAELGKFDLVAPEMLQGVSGGNKVKASDVLTAILNMPTEKASILEFKNRLLTKLQNRSRNESLQKLVLDSSEGLAAGSKRRLDWAELLRCLLLAS